MDYQKLANELLKNLLMHHRVKPKKNIDEFLLGENFVLAYINGQNGDVQPGEIRGAMNVSTARIASALNNLEKKELITREIDTKNRRQILVKITEKGKELAENHKKEVLGLAVKMLKLLGEYDAREYVRITKRMAEILPQIN